jgi:hypothetical protein
MVSCCSNSGSITDDPHWTFRKNSLELIELSKNLLGIYLNEHLSWSSHIDYLLTSCHGILAVLKKLKNLTPFHVRKTLVESLVLSKIDYASLIFHPLPIYQQKRLQRLQNACAGFVLRRFARQGDLATLNWLSISKRMDFNILK